jgi:Uma2 family endonuclease
VRTYWIVDPGNESIEVHRLETGGYRLAERASGEDEVR